MLNIEVRQILPQDDSQFASFENFKLDP